MNVTKKKMGSELELICAGRLESTTAPILEEEVKGVDAGITSLILNFAEVEYVSSAGLRVILIAQKKMAAAKGKMKLTGVNKAVMQVFEMTKMSKVLTIE